MSSYLGFREPRHILPQLWNHNKCMHFFQGFYDEVASPLLSEVDLRYPDNAVDFLTTNHFSQLFNGSEIVVAGRLIDNNLDNFLVEVFGQGVRRKNNSRNSEKS